MLDMKPINFSNIEKFLERVKLAEKSNQKNVVLDIKEAGQLKETIDLLVLRFLEKNLNNSKIEKEVTTVNADGGKF